MLISGIESSGFDLAFAYKFKVCFGLVSRPPPHVGSPCRYKCRTHHTEETNRQRDADAPLLVSLGFDRCVRCGKTYKELKNLVTQDTGHAHSRAPRACCPKAKGERQKARNKKAGQKHKGRREGSQGISSRCPPRRIKIAS